MTGPSRSQLVKGPSWRHIQSIFPSEMQQALANNSPPTSGALQSARAFRSDKAAFSKASKMRIDDIEFEIKLLQRERNLLADADRARAAVLEACATVKAPVRRLPRDILHEIALHSLPTFPAPSRQQAPMTLSHVSSAWRSVVLQTPHLWTALYLTIKSMDPYSLLKDAQIVETWFGRAGPLPINLYLYVECEIDEDLAQNFCVFLAEMARWMTRVARLGIGGKSWLKLMALFADIEWDLPNLHTLELLGQQCREGELMTDDLVALRAVADRIKMFRTTPRLTTLVANQEITTFALAFEFLPWKALAHVVLQESLSHQTETWSLLTVQCPNLQSAHLCLLGSVFLVAPSPRIISKLTHLKLEIEPQQWNDFPRFFSCFRFETLLNLDISTAGSVEEPAEIVHSNYSVEAFPSLQVLRLDSGFLASSAIALVQMMPRLRILVMNFSGSPANFSKLLNAMVLSDSQPMLLPLLEECSVLRWGEPILVDTSTLSRFVRSRTQNLPPDCATLKRLWLTGDFEFLRDLSEEITAASTGSHSALELKLFSDFESRYHDSLHKVQLPAARFAGTWRRLPHNYSDTIDHVTFLESDD